MNACVFLALLLVMMIGLAAGGGRTSCRAQDRDAASPSTSALWAKAAGAHEAMWQSYTDPSTFQVYTYLDAKTLKPLLPKTGAGELKSGGWSTAIENCSLDGGAYLGGLVDRFQVTGRPEHAEEARKIYQGLRLIAECARRKGCIPRGVMPDRKTHYPESSVDQYTEYVYGLWRYFRSPIATEQERGEMRIIFDSILRRLEEDRFVILTDTGGPTTFGNLDAQKPSRAERLLAIVLAGADITQDPHWREVYLSLRGPRLKHCRGLGGEPWVLMQNQSAFFLLRHLEEDPEALRVYQAGSLEAAQNCVPYLARCRVSTGDREFVATVMNPLEAALTIALTEDRGFIAAHLASIERVVLTYDYSKSLLGTKLFVNGVRPVECIVWSLARQGMIERP